MKLRCVFAAISTCSLPWHCSLVRNWIEKRIHSERNDRTFIAYTTMLNTKIICMYIVHASTVSYNIVRLWTAASDSVFTVQIINSFFVYYFISVRHTVYAVVTIDSRATFFSDDSWCSCFCVCECLCIASLGRYHSNICGWFFFSFEFSSLYLFRLCGLNLTIYQRSRKRHIEIAA